MDAQLAQARADLSTSQANVKLAGITAQRYQELLQSDAVSKQDVDNYNGDYAAKQAMVQPAAANLQRLEELESFKRVYAPFAGVITKRNVDIGNVINAGNGGTSTPRNVRSWRRPTSLRVYVAAPQTSPTSIHDGHEGLPGTQRVSRRQNPAKRWFAPPARSIPQPALCLPKWMLPNPT